MKYCQAIHELALDIGCKLSQSLGLGGDLLKGWPCQLWLNKYNFTPQTVGITGGQLHSDVGFLTILQADEMVGGLEVLMNDDSGTYIAVDPLPEASRTTLFVNLGDLAKVSHKIFKIRNNLLYMRIYMKSTYILQFLWKF